MKYFTIEELCNSTTAKQKGIDNSPSPEIEKKLTALTDDLLDPIREKWGSAIFVNSGYRCEALNSAVGGAKNSQHMSGEAADLYVGSKEKNKNLFEMIQTYFDFDQLINEYDYSWVHVSNRSGGNRREILKIG